MISLAEFSSNKNIKGPVIGHVTIWLVLSRLLINEVNNQTALFNESVQREKNGKRYRAKEKCTINNHCKRKKFSSETL